MTPSEYGIKIIKDYLKGVEMKRIKTKIKLYNILSTEFENCHILINNSESKDFQTKLMIFLDAKNELLKLMTNEFLETNIITKALLISELEERGIEDED